MKSTSGATPLQRTRSDNFWEDRIPLDMKPEVCNATVNTKWLISNRQKRGEMSRKQTRILLWDKIIFMCNYVSGSVAIATNLFLHLLDEVLFNKIVLSWTEPIRVFSYLFFSIAGMERVRHRVSSSTKYFCYCKIAMWVRYLRKNAKR